MEILTREGRNSWFPSGVYFSRVNRVFVLSFFFFFLLFCLEWAWAFSLPPASITSNLTAAMGSAITSQQWVRGEDEERNPSSWEAAAGHTARNTSLPSNDDMLLGVGHGGTHVLNDRMKERWGPTICGKQVVVIQRQGLRPKTDSKTQLLKIPQSIWDIIRAKHSRRCLRWGQRIYGSF